MRTKINIGLFGLGTVGKGLLHVISKNPSENIKISKICVRDTSKKRNVDESLITYNYSDILDNPDINLVVELIDDDKEAYKIVKTALLNGKSVVSANKKMLANNLAEIIKIQEENNVVCLYDASSCGSIPVIRNLEEYYDNDLLTSVTGILNGSSNFILSKIFNEKLDYNKALKMAQDLGYAESNPIFDVEGFDSLYKLIIIAAHSFGVILNPDEVFNSGISNITTHDLQYALEKGYKIKLLGNVFKKKENYVSAFVMPKLVKANEYIYNVENQFNGVVIQGLFYDKQFMFGKGAGANPTGSAVLSDIMARTHNYQYEYKKMKYHKVPKFTQDIFIEVYLRYNDINDLKYFNFKEIKEEHKAKDYNYIIGKINLSELIKIKELIRNLDVFLAYIKIY